MNVVMLGAPMTGKTSYGVGLYGGARNKAFKSLKIRAVNDPVGTLNAGQRLLGERKSVERTAIGNVDKIGLTVEIPEEQVHTVQIPDRSGEALQGSLSGRSWEPGLLGDLQEAEGLMIFINPLQIQPGEPVDELAYFVSNPDTTDDETTAWEPAMMPTDASLVDALQEIGDATEAASLPTVVVLSAWDEIAGETPEQWLMRRVPLLAQFLACREDGFASRVFGVSVQGGSFEGAGSELGEDEPDPWDRAWAVNGKGEKVELAEPLIWLLRSASG